MSGFVCKKVLLEYLYRYILNREAVDLECCVPDLQMIIFMLVNVILDVIFINNNKNNI